MTERAGIYGGSLYDLAADENLSDAIMEQLLQVKGIFRENPDYLRLLSAPVIKKEDRLKMIDEAFGASCEKYLVSFLKILCERDLLGEYEGCCAAYQKRYNTDHNIAEAVVTTAIELTEKQLLALKAKLESSTGKTVQVTQRVSPGVMAGIRVELDGKLLDGTLSGRLDGMARKLSEISL